MKALFSFTLIIVIAAITSIRASNNFARPDKSDIVQAINKLLKDNPDDNGYYSLIAIVSEKLVINKYDKQNNNWCKTEGYLSDLTKYDKGNNFGTIGFVCNNNANCVKTVSTVTYNISLGINGEHIHSINEANISPTYSNYMTVEFKPDSKICNELMELFPKLYN